MTTAHSHHRTPRPSSHRSLTRSHRLLQHTNHNVGASVHSFTHPPMRDAGDNRTGTVVVGLEDGAGR